MQKFCNVCFERKRSLSTFLGHLAMPKMSLYDHDLSLSLVLSFVLSLSVLLVVSVSVDSYLLFKI